MPSRKGSAAMRFRQQIGCLVATGLVSVVAALAYLASDGPLTGPLAFAVTFGVFVSIVLGGGLMAAGFYSSGSGLDDVVSQVSAEQQAAGIILEQQSADSGPLDLIPTERKGSRP